MLRPLDPVGLVVATGFAALSMTPSLLPREWFYQGIVSGITAAVGYGVGTSLRAAVAAVARRTRWGRSAAVALARREPRLGRRLAWAALAASLVTVLVAMLVAGLVWQRRTAALVDADVASGAVWALTGPMLVVVAAVLLALARSVRWLAGAVARLLQRRTGLPPSVAAATGALVAVALTTLVVLDVVLRPGFRVVDRVFAEVNTGTPDAVAQPVASERSGSPASLVPWDTLGKQGRVFVSGGPTREELTQASGRPAREPVRAYVGLDTAPTPSARAAEAVEELERAGGLEREVLVVVGTTGTGWVDEAAASAVELVHGGDTALVASQYSYLPSWISFLVDRERAADEGRALFDAVADRVDAMPPEARPQLIAYGESLGSFSSQAPFDSIAEVRDRSDGALWVGPPHASTLWQRVVARREPGTTLASPLVDGGRAVRLAGDAAELAEPPRPWRSPRVAYLQHGSDPVVWWTPDLLFSRPAWLAEPATDDVIAAMSWYPVVTFWQVSADLANSQAVPDGHGHNYRALALDAVADLVPPQGWSRADTERARIVHAEVVERAMEIEG